MKFLYKWGIPTWYRHLFFRFTTTTLFLIIILFGLFVFADLLSHIKDVLDKETSWKTWLQYYECLLSRRLEVLIPFSVATSTILVFSQAVRNREFIPLMNAGVSLKSLAMPCLTATILFSLLLSINYQWIYPKEIITYNEIVDTDFGRKKEVEKENRLGVILLKDGVKLFFNRHNKQKKLIEDVFVVRSSDSILHIEKLFYFPDRSAEAHFMDVIERTKDNSMEKTISYNTIELTDIDISEGVVKTATTEPKDLAITKLYGLMERFGSSHSERALEVTLSFFQKLLFPLLTVLAFLIPTPLCLRFEKKVHPALLLFFSLGFLFFFQIFVHAFQILAHIPFLPATPILIFPWAITLFFAIKGYRKIVV